MVLRQLPPRKIAPPQPSKLTLTLTGSNFPWEQLSGYLSLRLQLQYKIYFHKGSIHILCNHRIGEGWPLKYIDMIDMGKGSGDWPYDISK